MANYGNFTDELRARLSIVDVVSRRVPLTKKGLNYWGCCPFHNEKTPSFSVNEEKGFYHCFGCGEHGDIISFVMKSENMDFRAAIAELANMAGLKLPEYKPKSEAQVKREESYFDITTRAATAYHKRLFEPDGAAALEYIRGRGFTDEMIKKYKLGYAPKNNFIANTFTNIRPENLILSGLCRRGEFGLYDFFRDKLMFPIFNPNGQIVAFSGRAMDGREPKYINTTDTELFHKRKTVFGLNFARDAIHRANRSIVVEGQIDAIQMQCSGFGETVAPLGTALTEDHIGLLCKSNRNITFCFDGDNAGQKAAARAAGLVLPFVRDNSEIKFAFVTGGKDPDEVLKTGGADAMRKIIDNATPLFDFMWKNLNAQFVTSTPGGRSQAEKFLKKELEKITDTDLRREYDKAFAQLKYQNWHKWRRDKDTQNISLPPVDAVTKNTLIYITNAFPDITERYGDFLASLNIDFDGVSPDLGWKANDAEKYIVSLKLQRHLARLRIQKKELLTMALAGDAGATAKVSEIDADIVKYSEKLETLISI
ncbi:MAG: DNA primase [Muribaculaceae bacterium]|nr:DNA primase [Muribaculaceae bacterium]